LGIWVLNWDDDYKNVDGFMAYYNKHKDLPVDAIWVGREYMKSKMVFNGIEPSFDGLADAMK